MDSSSSASSSSPSYQYNGAVSFPASSTSSGRPRWPDLPFYESAPHYPLSISPYSNYGYDYGSFNHAGVRGGDTGDPGGGSMAVDVSERREGDEAMEAVKDREHMFDKVVTPSDVGKLNRLVIPKQHAEKYFPLDSASGDSKGLLLNFEDRSGKSWLFRYSYWNSSQSYVMTKGWSRFVKEKKLDAGDIVSFHRGVDESDKDRFYIDWRRRPDAPPYHHPLYRFHTYPADAVQFPHDFSLHRPIHPPFYNLSPPMPPPTLVDHHRHALDLHRGSLVGYNALTTNSTSSGGYGGNYGMVSPNFCHHQSGSVIYLGAAAAAVAPQQQMRGAGRSSQMRIGGAIDEPTVSNSVPEVHGGKAASAKRFRLFGVNMDCTDPQDECDINLQQHHLHDFILDSDRISSSPGGESALQLRLHNSSASTSSMQASEFIDKGKSSMSLDLDI